MEFHLPTYFNQQGVNVASPIVQNGGVGYNPTPPTFRYNGDSPQQTMQYNYNPYIQICQYGQYAAQQLQPPQMYNGYIGYNQYPYYNQSYMQQQKNEVYNEAYKNGEMSLVDYCFYNNGGIKANTFTGVDGQPVYLNQQGDDWYSGATELMHRRQEAQRQYQEQYNNQLTIWKMMCEMNDKYLGIERDASEDIDKMLVYQQKMQARKYELAKEEYEADCLVSFVRSLPNSTQKNYVSPMKEYFVNNWNKYYHQRNDKYPASYGLDEFFNQGIMTSQIFDDMIDDAKQREKELYRLYDKQQFRDYMHQLHPEYDPVTGTSTGARRLGIDDIEVTLPPQLAQQDYLQRRQKFMDSIFKDNRMNLQGAI